MKRTDEPATPGWKGYALMSVVAFCGGFTSGFLFELIRDWWGR